MLTLVLSRLKEDAAAIDARLAAGDLLMLCDREFASGILLDQLQKDALPDDRASVAGTSAPNDGLLLGDPSRSSRTKPRLEDLAIVTTTPPRGSLGSLPGDDDDEDGAEASVAGPKAPATLTSMSRAIVAEAGRVPASDTVKVLQRYGLSNYQIRTCYDARTPAARAVAIATICDKLNMRNAF